MWSVPLTSVGINSDASCLQKPLVFHLTAVFYDHHHDHHLSITNMLLWIQQPQQLIDIISLGYQPAPTRSGLWGRFIFLVWRWIHSITRISLVPNTLLTSLYHPLFPTGLSGDLFIETLTLQVQQWKRWAAFYKADWMWFVKGCWFNLWVLQKDS